MPTPARTPTRRHLRLGGWGRCPVADCEVTDGSDIGAIRAAVAAGSLGVRGAGRSYGDSSLAARVLDMSRLARLRSFDQATGVVSVDAGVTLAELLRVLAPRGWFPPVTPGTRFVTVGGALASDVHGKNHHLAGSFADHVLAFELMLGGGELITVTRQREGDLFRATCGGMGLTGVIVSVTLQLLAIRSSEIVQRTLKLPDLQSTVAAIDAHAAWTYSAAWVDCVRRRGRLGRSLLLLGEHAPDGRLDDAAPGQPAITLPYDPPMCIPSRPVVSVFNSLYYSCRRDQARPSRVPYASFFYPLDLAAGWNRLYGRRGFLQHQFVTPAEAGLDPLGEALGLIAAADVPAPLAVLKAFGDGNTNLLSFPRRGYALSIDLPATPTAFKLLERLDALVLAAGGRIYLSKDARMSKDTFRACYPSWQEFEQIRASHGALGHFATLQSKRLGLA